MNGLTKEQAALAVKRGLKELNEVERTISESTVLGPEQKKRMLLAIGDLREAGAEILFEASQGE